MATMKEIQEHEANRIHAELCLKSDIHLKTTHAIEESLNIAGIDNESIKKLNLSKEVKVLSKDFSVRIYNMINKIDFIN